MPKTEGRNLLLITDFQGNVGSCFSIEVFVSGSEKMFGCSHHHLFCANFFSELLQQQSKIQLKDKFKGEVMPQHQDYCEFVCILKRKRGNILFKVWARCWRCKVQFESGLLKERTVAIREMKEIGLVEEIEKENNIEEMMIIELEVLEEKTGKGKWRVIGGLKDIEEEIDAEIFEEQE